MTTIREEESSELSSAGDLMSTARAMVAWSVNVGMFGTLELLRGEVALGSVAGGGVIR